MKATARNVEVVCELSPLQEGLLVESLAAPEAALYVEQVVLDLNGPLEMPALAQAWRRIVDRHTILRTSFHWRDLDRPLQVVHRHATVPVSHSDLRGVPPTRRGSAVRWYLEQDKVRGFRFEHAPLVRIAVLRHGTASHQLVVTLHHILLDGWSLGIVIDEVGRAYRSLVDGVPCTFEPPRPYHEFVAWLRDQDLVEAERFWRDTIGDYEGAPPLARLGGRTASGPRAWSYAEHERVVPAEIAGPLRRVARAKRVTLNTAVLGAWGALLGQELGTDDLVIGAVVSGREGAGDGIERVVGLCINTVPVRVRLPADRPVGSWLVDLQAELVDLRRFEYCPLTDVHGWSGVPRGQPLFESIFIFENHAPQQVEGSARSPAGRAFERTSYPLTVIVGVAPELTLRVLYDTSVVDRAAVERLTGRLVELLGRIVRDPEQPICGLAAPDAAQRLQVGRLGTGAERPLPAGSVGELMAAAAARTPDGVALIDGERRLLLGELDSAADAIAHRLLERGMGSGDVVGVCLPPSADAAIALLGVLRAGAAFLALEPSAPPDWKEFALADSGARLVLGNAAHAPSTAFDVMLVDDPAGGEGGSLPVVGLSGVAWVVYTSGSSGLPKGVLGSQRGLVNRVVWGWRAQPYVAGEVALWKTRLGFVDAIAELFAPLAAGVPVVVADEALAADPRRLARLIVARGVTRLVAVPSLLSVLVEEAASELAASRLLQVTSSGEPLSGQLARQLRAVLPAGCRLVNLYGSTEVAADATCYQLEHDPGERVPIGRPIDNVHVRILGPNHELLPPGAIGQLYVGGAGLTPGYTGQAAHTHHDRFIDDPLQPGHTLYQTGDLARWRSDGHLDHLGRSDRQLKIRGVRVEPDEIEHVLRHHPHIREAAVINRPTPHGPELTAYLTTTTPQPAPDALRAYLRTRLPDQLIPTHLTILDHLPHLPNGKLDHTTLTNHTPTTDERRIASTAPRSAAEQIVADTFSDVLGVQDVGAFDDFFALGGHSLLATRLASALGRRFGIELPLGAIFQHSTVADLGAAVEELLLAEIRATDRGDDG